MGPATWGAGSVHVYGLVAVMAPSSVDACVSSSVVWSWAWGLGPLPAVPLGTSSKLQKAPTLVCLAGISVVEEAHDWTDPGTHWALQARGLLGPWLPALLLPGTLCRAVTPSPILVSFIPYHPLKPSAKLSPHHICITHAPHMHDRTHMH